MLPNADALLETLREPLVLLRADGGLEWANSAFQKAFGPDRAALLDALPRETVREFEIDRTIGVERRILLANATRLEDGRLLVALEDVTERRLLPLERLLAERRKDEFLATLAHELRNPMAPLRNGLQLMKLADPATREQARAMMERQLLQMVRLVDDLLDISRVSRGKLDLRTARIDLAAVVQTAVEMARPLIEDSNHTLTVTLPPSPVPLDGDLARLAQVIWNLLANSAKYTEPGGAIALSAEVVGLEAILQVMDSGIGIAKEQQPGLFEMFAQLDQSFERAQGGLGIGLALVKALTRAHGGRVTVHSEGVGRGSTFTIHLPIADGLAPAAVKPAVAAVPAPRRRVLVVDDNRDGAESLALLLTAMGNEAHTAHDGLEAVQKAEALRPDLIVLDIGLPKLNGYDACRRIRAMPWAKSITIVAATGWGQDEDLRRSQESGFDKHLIKPIDARELKKLLAT